MREGGRSAAGACVAVLFVAVLAVLAVLDVPSARAAGIEFVDQRAIVFDLDVPDRLTGRWTVEVANATGATTAITLRTAGVPAVRVVSATSPPVDAGGVTRFTIEVADRARAQQGQLMASTAAGAVARRDVRLVHGGRSGPVPDIHVTGRRLAPFIGPVLFGRPRDERWTPVESDVAVGIVRGSGNEPGRVVVDRGEVSVRNIDEPGEYSGVVRLGEGREAKVDVKVRDSFPWAVLVLVAGLLVVGKVEEIRKRELPRRYIELRFEELRESLQEEQRRAAETGYGNPRVTSVAPGEQLVFDLAVDEALQAMASAELTTGEEAWSESSEAFKKVLALRATAKSVLELHRAVAADIADLAPRLRPQEPQPSDLPMLDQVRRCLAIGPLGDETELAELKAHLEKQCQAVARFTQALDDIQDIIEADDVRADVVKQAEKKRRLLTTSPGPLDAVITQVIEYAAGVERRARRTALRAGAPSAPPVEEPIAVDAGMPREEHRPGPVPVSRASRPPAQLVFALVAILLVGGLAALLSAQRGDDDLGLATTTTTTSAIPAPPTSIPASPTTAIPATPTTARPGPLPPTARSGPLPTTTRPSPAPQPTAPPAPSTTTTVAPAAPTTFASAAAAPVPENVLPDSARRLGWEIALPFILVLLVFRLRAHVDAGLRRLIGQTRDSTVLRVRIKQQQRAFAVVSGVIVVLTGMSALYLGNDTFGSPADYVKVFLWGSAVGEGVQLARRLIPRLSG